MGGLSFMLEQDRERYNSEFITALENVYFNEIRLQTERIPGYLLSWLHTECEKGLGLQ